MQPQVATDDKLLFVGNLPFSMQWQDLKDLLRPAGRVQRTDISIGNDGRSRGWGTALFYTADEARRAVDMFNDAEVEGRKIKVRLDRLGVRGVPLQPRQTPAIRHGGDPTIGYPLQQQRLANHHAPVRNPTASASMTPDPHGSFNFGRPEGRSFRHQENPSRQDPAASDPRGAFYPGGGRSYWPPH